MAEVRTLASLWVVAHDWAWKTDAAVQYRQSRNSPNHGCASVHSRICSESPTRVDGQDISRQDWVSTLLSTDSRPRTRLRTKVTTRSA